MEVQSWQYRAMQCHFHQCDWPKLSLKSFSFYFFRTHTVSHFKHHDMTDTFVDYTEFFGGTRDHFRDGLSQNQEEIQPTLDSTRGKREKRFFLPFKNADVSQSLVRRDLNNTWALVKHFGWLCGITPLPVSSFSLEF